MTNENKQNSNLIIPFIIVVLVSIIITSPYLLIALDNHLLNDPFYLPVEKGFYFLSQLLDSNYKSIFVILYLLFLVSTSTFVTIKCLKQKYKLTKKDYIYYTSFLIVGLTIYVLFSAPITYTETYTVYSQSYNNFTDFCFATIILYLVLFLLATIWSFFLVYLLAFRPEIKSRLRLLLIMSFFFIAIWLTCFIIIKSNISLSNSDKTIEDLDNLQYELSQPYKKYMIAKADGTVIKYFLPAKYNLLRPISEDSYAYLDKYLYIPFNNNNVNIIKKQLQNINCGNSNNVLCEYLRKYYEYKLDFKSFDRLLTNIYNKCPSNSGDSIVCILKSFIVRYKPDIEALSNLTKIYHRKHFAYPEKSKCFLSVLYYKQNNIKQSQKYCLKDNETSFCRLCNDLLSSNIKKTVFKGQIINSSSEKIAIALIIDSNEFTGLNLVDLCYTNTNGEFELSSLTDKKLNLVIFTNKANSIEMNFSKLSDYKQGDIVDLGKILLEKKYFDSIDVNGLTI